MSSAPIQRFLFPFRVAILGDTSYGECCVDEVAAEHLGADGVIHFGRTCLTPTQRLPVLFVYTVLTLNVERLARELNAKFEERERVHVFYDVRYHKVRIIPRKLGIHRCQMNSLTVINNYVELHNECY